MSDPSKPTDAELREWCRALVKNRAHTLAQFVADAVNAFNKPLPKDDEIAF